MMILHLEEECESLCLEGSRWHLFVVFWALLACMQCYSLLLCKLCRQGLSL